MLHSEQVSI